MNAKQFLILMNEMQKPAYAVDLAAGDYAAVADTLNERNVIANPTPQPTRPTLIPWDTFIDLMDPADILIMYDKGVMPSHLRDALEDNNREITLALWRGLKTLLSPATIAAVQAAAAATELDPTWPATVTEPSIADGLGLPTVSADDVQTAWHRLSGE